MGETLTATVTVLFCDLVESTALAVQLGDGAADEVRHEVFDLLRAELTAHRGTEVKNLGDGLMASFGGNADAVAAAVGMQQKVDALGRQRQLPLALRIGISVGEATFEDGDWFGTPVVEASRLCAVAQAGRVLVTDVVRVLLGSRAEVPFRPSGEVDLKGLPNPIAVCEVEWAPLEVRAVELPLPRAFSLAPRFSLAGRAEEFEAATRAWKDASVGEGRILLIAGEPGIGKTRLAGELARSVDRDGGFVLLGRCDDGMGVPYQPFVECLAHVVNHASPDHLREMLGPSAGELCRVLPELGQRLGGLTSTTSDPETERFLLFEAVAAWLEAQSRIAPALMVLDDIHWAAEPTLQLLRHVLRSERDLRVLMLATYRDTEVDRTHPLGNLLADLRRSEGVQRIGLRGLDDEGVADLVERASGQELDDQARALARAVHAETGGNPFFAIEVLVSLAERGTIYQGVDGVWRSDLSIEEVGIPEGVKDVIGQRLSGLPEHCDEVLHAAAVAGHEVELDLLASVVGRSEDEVIDALEAARIAGLVDELGGRPVHYGFSHALVRQTLAEEIPTARRLRLHRAYAQAIESLRLSRLDQYRTALARHWYEAGTEPDRAIEAMAVAASAALDQFADREALSWLTRALELADDAGAEDRVRTDLMILRGEALRRVGDPAHREVLLDAGELAGHLGDGTRMARAALANGRGWQSDAGGVDQARVAALEAAIDAVGETAPGTRAELLIRLAVEKLYSPDAADRLDLATEAVRLARANGDPATLTAVLGSRHNVILSHDTIDERRVDSEEMHRLAEELGDPVVHQRVCTFEYFWRLQRGDVRGARRAVAEAAELSSRLGRPEFLWVNGWMQTALARLAGELDRAEDLLERTLEIGTEAGIPDAPVFYGFQHAPLLIDRAAPAGLSTLERYYDVLPEHYPGAHLYFAFGALLYGTVDRARSVLESVARGPFTAWGATPGPRDSELALTGALLGLAAALGEPDTWVVSAFDHMAPWPGQLYGNVAWNGPTEAYLAATAPLVGRHDELDPLLSEALDYCDRIDAPLNGVYARIYGACGLKLRDRPHDRDRATQLLDEAIEVGDRLGAGVARAAASNFPILTR